MRYIFNLASLFWIYDWFGKLRTTFQITSTIIHCVDLILLRVPGDACPRLIAQLRGFGVAGTCISISYYFERLARSSPTRLTVY
jgi:hypothetical protein